MGDILKLVLGGFGIKINVLFLATDYTDLHRLKKIIKKISGNPCNLWQKQFIVICYLYQCQKGEFNVKYCKFIQKLLMVLGNKF